MIIRSTRHEDIHTLKRLWKEAFDDTDKFINDFFDLSFSVYRSLCACEDDLPVSVLYWFDCEADNKKAAYIYGVATAKAFQGKGIASELIQRGHEILKDQGYDFVILVPAKKSLFEFYSRLGYLPCAYVDEIEIKASLNRVGTRMLSIKEYFEKF